MSIPDKVQIVALLDRLDSCIADDLESQFLDFKPWQGPKDDLKLACEYACCFANGSGGAVVFGVVDKVQGRAQAIHGAKGYDLDTFRHGIFNGTRPGIEAEVEEIDVPEGTGKILVVRVAEGSRKPYGTAAGLFKQRVGKNCMPLDPVAFQRAQVSSAAVDWSGAPVVGLGLQDLDPLQIEQGALVRNAGIVRAGVLAGFGGGTGWTCDSCRTVVVCAPRSAD
jgi:ATP-dependent DNA helicase RecG